MGAGATAGAGAGAGAAGMAYNNPFSDSAPQMAQAGRPQSNGMAYQNIPSEQYWSNDGGAGAAGSGGFEPAPKSNKKKWWIIGGVVASLVVVAAVVGGVVGSQKSKNSSGGGSSSGGSSSGGTAGTSDPSAATFDKNPNLCVPLHISMRVDRELINRHQSFWGFAYSPSVRFRSSSICPSHRVLIFRAQYHPCAVLPKPMSPATSR